MSLGKSRIPKPADSSRKFIQRKQRTTTIDPFGERTKRGLETEGEESFRRTNG